ADAGPAVPAGNVLQDPVRVREVVEAGREGPARPVRLREDRGAIRRPRDHRVILRSVLKSRVSASRSPQIVGSAVSGGVTVRFIVAVDPATGAGAEMTLRPCTAPAGSARDRADGMSTICDAARPMGRDISSMPSMSPSPVKRPISANTLDGDLILSARRTVAVSFFAMSSLAFVTLARCEVRPRTRPFAASTPFWYMLCARDLPPFADALLSFS